MASLTVTETFQRFLELEQRSIDRINQMRADVRRTCLALEAEIEEAEKLLAECEELEISTT